MIDHDLSHQLHSLAATVDEPVDLAALRRRISIHGRRRAVAKAGFAGAGVAAVVGGLLVVRERPTPAESMLPAASPVASSAAQVEPTAALPDCAVVLAGLRAAQTTPDTAPPKEVRTDTSAAADFGFKGIVTIVAIDGPQLTFRNDDPNIAPPTGVATLDAATVWMDGPTQLDSPPTLQVGQQLGLATAVAADGVNHVLFIDVSASAGVGENSAPDKKIVEPGITLPPGPTAKSRGTITAVDAASITATLDDVSGQARTVAIDLATTTFYAGNTLCTPGSPTVGEQIGVAYHFDDAGNVVSDAVLLLP